jgi:hypothetical protein
MSISKVFTINNGTGRLQVWRADEATMLRLYIQRNYAVQRIYHVSLTKEEAENLIKDLQEVVKDM